MSIVAKSLKRIKENSEAKRAAAYTHTHRKRSFVIDKVHYIYFAVALLSLLVVASSAFSIYNSIKPYLHANNHWPTVRELKSKLIREEKAVSNASNTKMDLEELLILKRYDEMMKLAIKEHNLKYQGIYYFEKGNLDKAQQLLNTYLKHNPSDEQAIVFLSYVFYRRAQFKKALNLLEKIKSPGCNVYVDKAAVYESLNDMKTALKLYRKALSICRPATLKLKLTKKVIVLSYYLKNGNLK